VTDVVATMNRRDQLAAADAAAPRSARRRRQRLDDGSPGLSALAARP
jgi:hypothetical protein